MKESEARGRNSFQDLLKQACQWRTLQYILVSHLLVLYFGDINSGGCARKSKRWDRDAEKNTVMQVWLSGKNKKTHISAEYMCVCVCGWMGIYGGGGGEKRTKSLNMLLPWGRSAACDLEEQCGVMGTLNKWRKRRRKNEGKRKEGLKWRRQAEEA